MCGPRGHQPIHKHACCTLQAMCRLQVCAVSCILLLPHQEEADNHGRQERGPQLAPLQRTRPHVPCQKLRACMQACTHVCCVTPFLEARLHAHMLISVYTCLCLQWVQNSESYLNVKPAPLPLPQSNPGRDNHSVSDIERANPNSFPGLTVSQGLVHICIDEAYYMASPHPWPLHTTSCSSRYVLA